MANLDKQAEIAKTQVVVMAGGRAKRLGLDIPKCLLEISGKKLIDMCIESLAKQGFRNFVFLLGYKHEMVVDHIGNGRKYGIADAKFSIDPPSAAGWGKGKAFKYALANDNIIHSKRSIVVFPDDIVLEDNIFSKFVTHHIEAARKHGVFASTLLVPGTEYPYGVAEVDASGIITKFTEKPFLDKPTSVGIYVFEPKVYDIINDGIDLQDQSPVDLESTIMPKLVGEHKLASLFIPSDKWMPINTIKEYEHAIKVLSLRK